METVGHRLIRQVNETMTYRFGKYIIPTELAMEIKTHFANKNIKDMSRMRKLTFEDAEKIRKLKANTSITLMELATRYKVDFKTIWRIVNNETYLTREREYK